MKAAQSVNSEIGSSTLALADVREFNVDQTREGVDDCCDDRRVNGLGAVTAPRLEFLKRH